jgi:hypothetical protein
VALIKPAMSPYQKKTNQLFFEKILLLLPNNSVYFWLQETEIFTVKNGHFFGSIRGVEKIKQITPNEFHSRLKIEANL